MKFNELAFEETGIEIIDGDRGKNYPKKNELLNHGHTLFLNNKNIINNYLDDSFGEYITEEKSKVLRKGKLERGDIVMSTRGSVGNVGYYSSNIKTKNIRINSGMVILRNNDKAIDTEYLYVLLRSSFMKKRYIEMISGSVQSQLPIRDLKQIKIVVPPLHEQVEIKRIISHFDNKIENNNAIIANLEAQAQAIFKSWFIDFEPFQNGKFVDSELGEIPEGWEVSILQEIAKEIITGKTPSTKEKDNYGEDIPFITIPDMHNNVFVVETERYLSNKGANSQPKKTLRKNSIIISCIATVGLVSLISEDSHTNQQINGLIPKNNISPYFIYSFFKTQSKFLNNIGSSGSATKNVNKNTFSNIKLILPSQKILDSYNSLCEPIFEYILFLQKQNIRLRELRDTLLPKLMSGEIRVGKEDIE